MITKTRWRRWIGVGFALVLSGYIGSYLFLYSTKNDQAKRYRSNSLPNDFNFKFSQNFEELRFKTPQSGLVNALLFKAPNSKGVICFWKGNGGTLANWGEMAPLFLKLNYDVLITDYRQHGKSKGDITLANFYTDAQTVYNYLKGRYQENTIVVVGYSLGGRIAAHLAANNRPKFTLLLDPASQGGDFSDRMTDLVFFPLPSTNFFVFPTESDVQQAKKPTVVVSTENPHSVAYTLKPLLAKKDQFVVIPGATHQTILTHPVTAQLIAQLLKS